MAQISYGILGASQPATEFVKAIEQVEEAKVVAIAGRSLADAQKQAERLGLERAYGSYEELCEVSDVDVIYIPKYNRAHYACAKYALEHGKHVLMAQPFTRHKVGAGELFQLAANKNLLLMEEQSVLFLPLMQRIKAEVAKGTIGKLRFIEIKRYLKFANNNDWLQDLAAGGGALNVGGSNPLELAAYLTDGEVSEWAGFAENNIGEADRSASLTFKVADLLVNAFVTTELTGEDKLTLVGTDGKITVPNYIEAKVATVETTSGTNQLVDQNYQSGLAYLLAHFNECLAKGLVASPLVTPAQTIKALTVIEDLYQRWYGDPLN